MCLNLCDVQRKKCTYQRSSATDTEGVRQVKAHGETAKLEDIEGCDS